MVKCMCYDIWLGENCRLEGDDKLIKNAKELYFPLIPYYQCYYLIHTKRVMHRIAIKPSEYSTTQPAWSSL